MPYYVTPGDKDYTEVLPQVHYVYRLDDRSNLRAAVTRSLARPNFEDIAPWRLINREDEEIERGNAFCNQIGRFPLAVRSSPGFLVNRVLAQYMLKAFEIHLQRGVTKEAIDRAAEDFGMPMGPVELADTVGLDVGLNVLATLGGEEAAAESALLKSYVDQGKLGKKSGEGFYTWEKGKPKKDKDAVEGVNLASLAEELMQPYFDECKACLADGIVEAFRELERSTRQRR